MRYVNQVSRWRKFYRNANRVLVSVFGKNKKINSRGASPDTANKKQTIVILDFNGKDVQFIYPSYRG